MAENSSSHGQNDHTDIWAREHRSQAAAIAQHYPWLQHPCSEKNVDWQPSTLTRDESQIQDIQCGLGPTISLFPNPTQPTPWDEAAEQTFTHAAAIQEAHWQRWNNSQSQYPDEPGEDYVNNLTHVELDVWGVDRDEKRVRVQRILEVNLNVEVVYVDGSDEEHTTMEYKRSLVFRSVSEAMKETDGGREP